MEIQLGIFHVITFICQLVDKPFQSQLAVFQAEAKLSEEGVVEADRIKTSRHKLTTEIMSHGQQEVMSTVSGISQCIVRS